MKPHKHAELIKAWADGAEIQYKYKEEDVWHEHPCPYWDNTAMEFRIRPAKSRLEVTLEQALKEVRGRYLTKEEEALVDTIKSFRLIHAPVEEFDGYEDVVRTTIGSQEPVAWMRENEVWEGVYNFSKEKPPAYPDAIPLYTALKELSEEEYEEIFSTLEHDFWMTDCKTADGKWRNFPVELGIAIVKRASEK